MALTSQGAVAVEAPKPEAQAELHLLESPDARTSAAIEQAKAAKLEAGDSSDAHIASPDEAQAGYIDFTSHTSDERYFYTQGEICTVWGLATDHGRWGYYYVVIGVWDWYIEDYVLLYGPTQYVNYELVVAANIDTSGLAVSDGRYDVDMILVDAYFDGEWEDMQSIGLEILRQNTPPVAVADSYNVHGNRTTNIDRPGVLANDTDAEGDTLSVSKVSNPSHGTVFLSWNGSFSYTPTDGYLGPDSFTYRAHDGRSASEVQTVNINVGNNPPVATADSYGVNPDAPRTVTAAAGLLLNDVDPDGDTLSVSKLSDPSNGTVSVNADGSFTYTPSAGFTGTDSFTYRVYDGWVYSDPVSVTLLVADYAPESTPDEYSVHSNTQLVVGAPGVLSNDRDMNGDPLTVHLVSAPTHGTLTLNADGSFTYTPDAGYGGASATDSFEYRVSDGRSFSENTAVTIAVTNVAPEGWSDWYEGRVNEAADIWCSVLRNDVDADDDMLTVVPLTDPTHGTLVWGSEGWFTYEPDTDWWGTDHFSYRIWDGTAFSDPVPVAIDVLERAPIATTDAYTATMDVPRDVLAPGVLSNDYDADGHQLQAVKVTDPSHGTVGMQLNGSFTYTPDAGYTGSDSFTYKAYDGYLYSDPITVTITVSDPYTPMAVYRFYRMSTGTHFYTADVTERDRVRNTMGSAYYYEGTAYTINTANPANSVPLYRFYYARAGTHLYTADENEKNVLAKPASGYSLDGVAYAVSMTGGTEVHRFFNPDKCVHFYSADPAEVAFVRATLGRTWWYEGRAYFIAQ